MADPETDGLGATVASGQGPGSPQGLPFSIGSIAAGVIGFAVPVLGMLAAVAGIWLGVTGYRRGRTANDKSAVTCGLIGASVSLLSIGFWIMVVLFESYR